MAQAAELSNDWTVLDQKLKTFNRLMTTKAAIGQTPKELIWTLNKAKLYRYIPVVPAEERYPIPLILIFALMNRPTIMDLRPGHSFVEYMVGKGYDVLSSGLGSSRAGRQETEVRRLHARLHAASDSEDEGGVGRKRIQHAGLVHRCDSDHDLCSHCDRMTDLRNLLLLTAPLDFSNRQGLTFARWTDEKYFDVDKVLATFGNMPGEMIDYGAKALKPVENYITNYCKLWDSLEDPRVVEAWHSMNTWVTDIFPMAGGAYRQLIVDLYRNNRLMRGELKIRGEVVDLKQLRANLLNVIAEGDHITPPCQSEAILPKVGSTDTEIYRVPGGHIGIMAGSGAHKRTWPHIDSWLAARSR